MDRTVRYQGRVQPPKPPLPPPSGWGVSSPEIIQYTVVFGSLDSPVLPRGTDPVTVNVLSAVEVPSLPRRPRREQPRLEILVPAAPHRLAWVEAPALTELPGQPSAIGFIHLVEAPSPVVNATWVTAPERQSARRPPRPELGLIVYPAPISAWVVSVEPTLRRRTQGLGVSLSVPATVTERAWIASGPEPTRRRAVNWVGVYLPVSQQAPETLSAWTMTAVDVPMRRKLPAGGDLPLPAAATFLAWVSPADRPIRLKSPATAQDLPQGASDAFSAWVAPEPARSRSARILGDFQLLPVQQVPTQFVGNAWVIAWDGPRWHGLKAPAQRFDDPVLGAYATVVVTYPDGWRGVEPQPIVRPRMRGAETSPMPPAFVNGWSVSVEPSPRRIKQREPSVETVRVETPMAMAWITAADFVTRRAPRGTAGEIVRPDAKAPMAWVTAEPVRPVRSRSRDTPPMSVPARPQPYGWSVEVPLTRMHLSRPTGVDTPPIEPSRAAAAIALVWGVDTPAKDIRPLAALLWPPPPIPQALTGVGPDLWGFISYRFRTIVPAAPQTALVVRPLARIIFTPPLFGGSTAPTLYGASTAPSLLGASTAPSLTGVSTAPTLLGGSTDPDLSGGV